MFDSLRDSVVGAVGSPAVLTDVRLVDVMVGLHRLEEVVAERMLALMSAATGPAPRTARPASTPKAESTNNASTTPPREVNATCESCSAGTAMTQ
ncbi:hypothetical protein G4X40_16195 [Rhodococcus sp. D2-41]|uniref:hypothetical protein n=1 Tax=Speluncibacter jeojiensis TaxID=2710754 RepID=UPI00240FCFC4|nr:hypothetical protein [Rhodococcus sp. D2-41]MDG3011686.1 hypothetical protein [Rhodococcus sp. D2-41]